MLNTTVKHVAKQSFLYSCVLSQPFTVFVNAYPFIQSKALLEEEYLNYGEHGESIRILQHKLNKLSYFDDEIDGDFNILTEHAIKKFQKDHGITVTGQANRKTLHIIIRAERSKYINQLVNVTDSISPGMKNDDVGIVQKALYYFGYYKGKIDNSYGPLTARAIKTAEERHKIDLTEEVTETHVQTLHTSVEHDSSENNDIKINESKKEESNPIEVKVKKKEKVKKVDVVQSSNGGTVSVARSLIGTPYVWGGQSVKGFDCSGFIQYVFATQNVTVPRSVNDMWNFASSVGKPSVGDLVFYETYKPGPSHMGIYIGNNSFIHAGTNGVEVTDMSYRYWQERYLGAKRVK
ncbi:NlpC/P60 family protein [Virgibacillus flavescens]|uniref:C40 family peptidase n=1 Tax=Virgibacillus flavescens TaxID=1611422 RepID=UPI003D334C28